MKNEKVLLPCAPIWQKGTKGSKQLYPQNGDEFLFDVYRQAEHVHIPRWTGRRTDRKVRKKEDRLLAYLTASFYIIEFFFLHKRMVEREGGGG